MQKHSESRRAKSHSSAPTQSTLQPMDRRLLLLLLLLLWLLLRAIHGQPMRRPMT